MKLPVTLVLFSAAALSLAQSGLWVEVPSSRAPGDIRSATDNAVRRFGKNVAALTELPRQRLTAAGRYDDRVPFSLPTTVHLVSHGRVLRPQPHDPGDDLVLAFDSSGAQAFPPAYQDLLQSVFDTAKTTLNVIFAKPANGGTVLVKNFDATIGDRDAVAGGYFLPDNGSGQPEIRFPVYVSAEAAAVNFIHCLLLAYTGPDTFGFDAFQEGFVRAATMKVARTPAAIPPGLDPDLVNAVLENTYDVGPFYDWYNQRALGGHTFIAPNLKNVPLPPGGSLGGIYLLRYQMAGTAWQKLLTENPGYLAEFNRRYYLNPGAGNNVAQLALIGQAALDTVKGAANSKVEGYSFADWLSRQYILETADTLGKKVLVQPTPINNGLGGSDFGVFDVSATYFETQAGGNELLLSGLAYPMFWDQFFNRIFPSSQEDQMPIAAAFGSVAPNLPDINGGQIYRCTVDIPVGDRLARAYLPAGAIATAANPDPNNFYGTLIGLTPGAGASLRVRVTAGSKVVAETSVVNGAYGAKITDAAYTGYARLKLDILQSVGSTLTLLSTRFVNKGPGDLAVDFRAGGDGAYTLPGGLLKGIQMIGFPIDPWVSAAEDLLGLQTNQLQIARYNPNKVAYEFYPDSGPIVGGNGYFVRMETPTAITIKGRLHPKTPIAVALKPGWNLITCPIMEDTPIARVQVIKAALSPSTFSEALGVDIGTDFFSFLRGSADQFSGAPEGGTMVKAVQFEPGKAYYVRVLAPEGISLLFSPSNFAGKPGKPFVQTGWRMRARMDTGPTRTEVVLGQSNTATHSFDRKEDGALPPLASSGIQMMVESSAKFYRDVRRVNTGETFTIRMDGLTVGKYYNVYFADTLGTSPSFLLRDPANHLTWPDLRAPCGYSFIARASTHRIMIDVFGGSN